MNIRKCLISTAAGLIGPAAGTFAAAACLPTTSNAGQSLEFSTVFRYNGSEITVGLDVNPAGAEPTCPEEADVVPGVPVEINVADLDYLISHIFRGGPALPEKT